MKFCFYVLLLQLLLLAPISAQCQNGGSPVMVNGEPFVLKGKVFCDCTKSPNYQETEYGGSIWGPQCQNTCNRECMSNCVSCLQGHLTVWEGNDKNDPSSFGCSSYCGGGAPLIAYTDNCCLSSCQCDPTRGGNSRPPSVVSGCLDATSEADCMGEKMEGQCKAGTISFPAQGCPGGKICEYKNYGRGRVVGICVDPGESRSLRLRKGSGISSMNSTSKTGDRSVGCVYGDDYGTVIGQDNQNACLSISDKGPSQEKIVHSNQIVLKSYAVNHAPGVAYSDRFTLWQNVTAYQTGKTDEFYDHLRANGRFEEYHKRLSQAQVGSWWNDLWNDACDFGEELWGGVKAVCSNVGWGTCWSAVTTVLGCFAAEEFNSTATVA